MTYDGNVSENRTPETTAQLIISLDGSRTSHLVWGEVVQQLPDVVIVLDLPVVAGPGHTVLPAAGAVRHQGPIHGLQHLQRLGSGQLQRTLHKLGVSADGEQTLTSAHPNTAQQPPWWGDLREVLHGILCWLLEETLKLITCPLGEESIKAKVERWSGLRIFTYCTKSCVRVSSFIHQGGTRPTSYYG